MTGKVKVVGLGPGSPQLLAPACRRAIKTADMIFGYTTYLELIAKIAPEIPRQASGMRMEVARARQALHFAALGKTAVVVSGGDAGIYGMAGLIYEVREREKLSVAIEVLPGISALNAAAALLGAPLMTDFAVLSLSDQLVPLEEISNRLEAAARTDFILCLYNPKSKKRELPFRFACEVLQKWRAPGTVVGIVRSAYRTGQQVDLLELRDLPHAEVDMLTVILVGNERTRIIDGKMVTPRGYQNKYKGLNDNDDQEPA